MNKIPFVDLNAQRLEIKEELENAIEKVIVKGKFIQGDEVRDFEEKFASYLNVKFTVGVNSGTDALVLGVRALNLPAGSEIIVPANSYISSALAASENNLKPVFADIDDNDFGINLLDLKKKINSKTKAVIIVHLYGCPDKLSEINNIIRASNKKIHIIEDACQAHGANYEKKRVGGFGIFSAFSFYPGKNLGAYGDGGAVATNDEKLYGKIRLIREYGQREKYYHDTLGINSRLDTLQAAILLVKLKYLDKWNAQRNVIAKYYSQKIKQELQDVVIPGVFSERKSAWHIYCVRVKKRDMLLKFLRSKNIEAQIHYPVPIHLQKAYAYLNYKKGSLPIVEKISNEIISLPLYPQMKFETVDLIVKHIKDFYS